MLNTFETVMKEFAGAFESAKHADSKSTYYRLRDNAPEWLKGDAGSTVMREIHEALDDRLPDDWVYEAVSSLTDAFVDHRCSDEDEAREACHEIADGLVDVYNSDRIKWLGLHMGNAALVDEACSEFGAEGKDTFDRIGLGQFYAYERLANAVIDAVQAEADSRPEPEDEDEEAEQAST